MEWLPVIQTVGIPCAILAVLIYGVWQGSKAIMRDVIKVLVAEYVLTLKELREAYKSLAKDSSEIAKAYIDISKRIGGPSA